jgi:hypothetical protein
MRELSGNRKTFRLSPGFDYGVQLAPVEAHVDARIGGRGGGVRDHSRLV